MNLLKKLSMGAVLGVLALASTAPAQAGHVFGVHLPDLSAVTIEIAKSIAAEAAAQLRKAMTMPRPARERQTPSVTITELDALVVVEAKRLAPIDTMEAMRVAGSTQVRL